MSIVHWSLAVLLMLVGAMVPPAGAATPDGNPRTIYFSTGDNQDLIGLPMDSSASIDAVFEAIGRSYQADRVWWRGGQDEVWADQFVMRPENRGMYRLWEWWKDLACRQVKTNALAVKAAHARGMQIWMAYGLFDQGSSADVGYVGFPFPTEDKLRVAHPEWAPLNRYGTWRQGGPIEFCYPAARQAVVEYLTRHVVDGGYDGIAFLTYVENYSQRYEDEFGFNPPIVEEFKKRYGVDIRTQDFDRAAWGKLRGEYLTEFLRQLHNALGGHSKKVAVCVDGQDPYLPCRWNVVPGGVRTAGRIYFDLEIWVREGIVDELNVYAPATDEAVTRCIALCRGTRTQCSVFRTRGAMPAGAPRLMFLGTDVESGFPWENYIGLSDENIPPQLPEALDGADAFARRRILTAVCRKKQTLPVERIAAATKDPDLFVRLLALRALGLQGAAASRPAVEACLGDPENSVRCAAALALAQLPGPGTVQTLFATAQRADSTYQFNFRAIPEALRALQAKSNLSVADRQWIVTQAGGADAKVRTIALQTLVLVGAPPTPETQATMLRVLREDPDPACREMALTNLRSSFGPVPPVLAGVRAALHDQDDVVGLRAAVVLAAMVKSMGQPVQRQEAMAEVARFFRQYGAGSRRSDAAWGWRELGNAILATGDPGEALLKQMMADPNDRSLADLAWRVMYLKQGDSFSTVTAEQDRAAHALRPQ